MIDSIADWVQRVTYGATATWSSLIRIHLWAIAILLATPLVIPDRPSEIGPIVYNGVTIDSDHTQFLGLDDNDPRGFATNSNNETTFNIAWVSGSSLRLVDNNYYAVLPDLIGESINSIDGKPIETDVFFLQAMRLFDEYSALLAAIDTEPDLIVLTLNPMFVFNSQAIQNWDVLNGRTADYLVKHPEAWALASQLISPTDATWGILGSRIQPIEQRWSYGQSLRSVVEKWDPLDRSNLIQSGDEASEIEQIQAMGAPLDFWSTYRNDIFKRENTIDRQIGFLELSTPNGGTINDQILSLIAEAIRSSGIATYVYLAPVNPLELENPRVDALLASIENGLARHANEFNDTHIRFVPKSLSRSIPVFPFNDLVHLAKAEPLANIIAEELCSFLGDLDQTTSCNVRSNR